MTALEQALSQELEQEKQLNIEIIDRLDKQELQFTRILQNEQRAYESNLSKIVKNHKESMEKMESNYKSYLSQNREELEKLSTELSQVNNTLEKLKLLLVHLPSYESLEQDLKTLLRIRES